MTNPAPDATPTPTPTPAPTPTPTPAPTPTVGFDLGPLMQRIDALPETLANALREANPQPPTTESKPDPQPDTKPDAEPNAKSDEKAQVPGKKTFVEWWFGK